LGAGAAGCKTIGYGCKWQLSAEAREKMTQGVNKLYFSATNLRPFRGVLCLQQVKA
jgi:hypothetical protein